MHKKPSKYKAQKTIVNSVRLDSKAEAHFYIYLLAEEKKGNLKIISLQPKVYLTDAKILYKPDFLIEENGKPVYIDVKGALLPVFQIKKRLWRYYGLGLLRLVKGGKTIEEINTVKNT